MASLHRTLHLFEFALEIFDLCVRGLEVLVEAVTLLDELLLPLTEAILFNLDLLCELLTKELLLFLELGVVKLAGTRLAKFPGLHLLCAVCLVVVLFGCVNQIEHVCADKDRAKLLEVAVILILDFRDTPRILTALDDTSVASLDILLRSYDCEWHSGHELLGVAGRRLIIVLNWWLVDCDSLCLNDSADSLLEFGQISGAQSVSLCDNRNQIDPGAEPPHDLNVQWLEGVSGRANEVKAGMNTQVDLVLSPGLLLLQHIRLVLVIQEFDDWHPRVTVVDIVPKARCVDNGQTDFEELLFQLGLGDLNFNGLVNLLLVSLLVVRVVLDCG